jgi:hypothetical protein
MSRVIAAVAVLTLVVPHSAALAQAFEGVIRMRTVSVGRSALDQLGATTPEEVSRCRSTGS